MGSGIDPALQQKWTNSSTYVRLQVWCIKGGLYLCSTLGLFFQVYLSSLLNMYLSRFGCKHLSRCTCLDVPKMYLIILRSRQLRWPIRHWGQNTTYLVGTPDECEAVAHRCWHEKPAVSQDHFSVSRTEEVRGEYGGWGTRRGCLTVG